MRKIICFDFDGTLCESQFPKIGKPNQKMISLVNKLFDENYEIIINSARQSIDSKDIEIFLKKNNVKYTNLFLSSKPVADFYIDDKGLFLDVDVLEMAIKYKLKDKYLDSYFFNNLKNVPENEGYQEIKDSNFKIAILITGGMDSLTIYRMVRESGLSYELFYINLGQEYSKLELSIANSFLFKGDKINVISKKIEMDQYKHILLGRNFYIFMLISEYFKLNNFWGEIWFGNLSGESPIHGGDKSRKFLNQTQSLLNVLDFNIRLVTPLIGMDKTDEVVYFKERGLINLLEKTKSCFHPVYRQCGNCQSCFRKYVAFKYNEIDILESFEDKNIKENFKPYIEKYKKLMNECLILNDYSKYSPSRIRSTLQVINDLEK